MINSIQSNRRNQSITTCTDHIYYSVIVNQFKDIDTIQAIAKQFKCRHIYLEVTYALNHSRNQAQVLKRYRQLAQHFLQQDYTVTVDIPNELASRYADLTKDKNFVMNVAIQIPDMHKLGDRVSMKFVGGADWNKSGGVYVADFDAIRTKKNFTPWSKYNKDVKVLENMDHSKDSRAVPELRAALLAHQDRLQKASDDQVYDIIDSIMTRIARSHSISGQKLHDMWVKRYKEIPDTWIMNQQLNELSFLGSPCTKDCSGHRAGYAWSQSKGGRVAQSPFSPSFNNGSQLYVDGK